MTEPASNRLAAVAARFRQDEADGGELTAALLDAVVFCRREEYVGFAAVGEPGHGWVPVYSSEEALAEAEGATDWFAALGSELLLLVPAGYGIVLDHGRDSEAWLPEGSFVRTVA